MIVRRLTWAGVEIQAPAATVVVDLLGSRESLEWSQGVLAPGGRMVVLTTFPGVTFDASPRALVLGQGSILGSRYATRDELKSAARLVETGAVSPVVSNSVGPQGVAAAHDALRSGAMLGRGALVWGADGGVP
jgi:D-arabinose 1-dehydrogenase-like Zn-dependent alcohol dehydrogenase